MATGLWLEKITELRHLNLADVLVQAAEFLPAELDEDQICVEETNEEWMQILLETPPFDQLGPDQDFLSQIWRDL